MNKRPAYEKRRENRLSDSERMKKLAKKLANDTLSCLPASISQKEFDEAWERIEAALGRRAKGSMALHELGFNTALSIAIKLVEENRWNVSVDYYFIRIERETVFRDEEWTKHAFELHEVYEHWLDDIQEKGFSQFTPYALADFFLSAIFHSGVCDAPRLLAIVKAMNNMRLSAFNHMPYLPYTVSDAHTKITNQIDGDGYRQHVGMCFLAPPTLALMNHLLKQKAKVYPNNLAELYELLRQRCGYLFSRKKLKSAIFITENLTKLTQPEVHFLVGNIHSFALPERQFIALEYRVVSERALSEFYNSALTSGNTVTVTSGPFKGDLYKNISEILIEASRQKYANAPKNRTQTIDRFQALIDNGVSGNEAIFIYWLIDLLRQNKAISTLQRYQSAIGKGWLASTEGEDLLSYLPADFELLYAEIIDEIPQLNEKQMASGRLADLHKFCVRKYFFPRLNDAFFSTQTPNSHPHVRADVVNELLFKQLIGAILQLRNTNKETIDTIIAMVIVAFRCGLRIGEIVKLRTKDVIADLDTTRLYVAPNEDGKNKSESSNRLVPFSAMLLPEEKAHIDIHLGRREKVKLLFSLPDNLHQVPPSQLISNLVIYYLREISGDQHYVFHHLRHSCMSRLQLLLYDETVSTLPLFVPYGKQQADKIKREVWKNNDKIEYAIAKFAGHESPVTTYNNYFHFTEYGIGKKLATLTLPTAGRLTKKSKSLEKLVLQCPKTQFLDSPSVKFIPSEITISKSTRKSYPSLTTIYSLLQRYHDGEDVDAWLLLHGIKKTDFERWYDNAKEIKKQSKTRYGNSTLFSADRKNAILPAQPQSQAEKKYIEQIIARLRASFREDKATFTFVIQYTLQHCSTKQSGVMFYSAEEFSRYINALVRLRLKSNLRALTHRANSDEWKKALEGIKQEVSEERENYQRNRSGSVRLQLIHPDEEKILSRQSDGEDRNMAKRTRYSSNLLVYLFHMMVITMKE